MGRCGEVLQVSETAEIGVAEASYRRLAKDAGPHNNARLKELNAAIGEARSVLKPVARCR